MSTTESTRMYQLRVDLELPAALVDDEEQRARTLVPVLEAVQAMLVEQGFSLNMFDKQTGVAKAHDITLAPVEVYGS